MTDEEEKDMWSNMAKSMLESDKSISQIAREYKEREEQKEEEGEG